MEGRYSQPLAEYMGYTRITLMEHVCIYWYGCPCIFRVEHIDSGFVFTIQHKNDINIHAHSLWRIIMVRTTITLPQDLLTELMSLLQTRTKTEAVITAIRDEIRLRKLERIKSMAGKLEFTVEADVLRHGDCRLG